MRSRASDVLLDWLDGRGRVHEADEVPVLQVFTAAAGGSGLRFELCSRADFSLETRYETRSFTQCIHQSTA